jgi:hypothetical protein
MTESINGRSYTFSLTHGHYNAFAQLAKDLGLNRSELLRRFIEALHRGEVKFVLAERPADDRAIGTLTVERTVAAEPTINAASVFAPGHGPATYAGGGFGAQPYPRLASGAVDFAAMNAEQLQRYAAEYGADDMPPQYRPQSMPDVSAESKAVIRAHQPPFPGQPSTPPLPASNWFTQRLASGNAPKAVLEEFDPSKPPADGQ